jgi:hypothetical protein
MNLKCGSDNDLECFDLCTFGMFELHQQHILEFRVSIGSGDRSTHHR